MCDAAIRQSPMVARLARIIQPAPLSQRAQSSLFVMGGEPLGWSNVHAIEQQPDAHWPNEIAHGAEKCEAEYGRRGAALHNI